MADLSFGYFVCDFNKDSFDRSSLTKEFIHRETVKGLVKHIKPYYLIAEGCRHGKTGLNEKVIYDRCSDRRYERALKDSFWSLASGRGAGKKLVGDIKPGKSRVDSCIQLADMVCGAVGHHLDGESAYYKMIRNKELGIEIVKGSPLGAPTHG